MYTLNITKAITKMLSLKTIRNELLFLRKAVII